MISLKVAMTLEIVAFVTCFMLLLVAHINVEAQQQWSDNDIYRLNDIVENTNGPWPISTGNHQYQDQVYYSAANQAGSQYSEDLSDLERLLLAAKGNDDLALAEAQSDAMRREQYLRQLQASAAEIPELSPIEVKKDDNLLLAHDLSSHWPATGLRDEQEQPALSQPVNEPEEFEAKLGQLTNELNHKMANTRTRQQLLIGLLNGTRPGDVDDDLRLEQLIRSTGSQDESSSSGANPDASESSSAGYLDGRSTGSEYIDRPLELTGHQYVQGGAGEGRQLLGPEGTFENVQVIKTDSAIPSYCDPPNPCPIGYTAKDGCLEDFVNLASFSREYQAKQKCSCDNEHSLFNCASANNLLAATNSELESGDKHANSLEQSGGNALESSSQNLNGNDNDNEVDGQQQQQEGALSDKLDTLARTIQNRFGDLASVQRLIGKQQELNENQEALSLAGNDDENSNYLVRSARKLSSLDMHHKVNLD